MAEPVEHVDAEPVDRPEERGERQGGGDHNDHQRDRDAAETGSQPLGRGVGRVTARAFLGSPLHGTGRDRSEDHEAIGNRTRLAARFAGNEKVVVLAPEEGERIPDGSLDLIVVNSLLQYLDRAELERLLAHFRAKLKPGGRLILADVLPPGLSAITDAAALLRFAARGRFLTAALAGLVRTAFSEYRTVRARLGLTHYAEAEMIALLRAAGFEAVRHHPNLGHNQARMAFRAVKPLSA